MNKFTQLSLACLAISLVMVGLVSAKPKSECETQRDKQETALKAQERNGGGAQAILVPKCNSDGTYAQLQCHANSQFCQCWDSDGTPMTAPKNKLKVCSCLIDRAKQLKSVPARETDIPEMTTCEVDGAYTKRQCNRTACWCVNPQTGAKLSKEDKNKQSVKC